MTHGYFAADDEHGFGDDTEDRLEDLCRAAIGLWEAGDVDDARSLASEAASLDDMHPYPFYVLAAIAETENDVIAARYLADRTLRRAPENADAIQLRARIHEREFEFDRAERLLRYGIARNPEAADLHEHLARVCLAQGAVDSARVAADAAIQLDPTAIAAHAVRCAVLAEQGDNSAHLAALRQATLLAPDDPFPMVQLAQVEIERGNIRRGRTLIARAYRLAPDDPDLIFAQRSIESYAASRLLRPWPRLTRWLDEFPGQLPGFLAAVILSALPLHALATNYPRYAVTAWSVLAALCLLGVYCLLAPIWALAAARRATATALLAADTERAPAQTLDIAELFVGGNRYRAACKLLRTAAESTHHGARDDTTLASALTTLRRARYRVMAALTFPGLTRLLFACCAALLVLAPQLDTLTPLPGWGWDLVAAAVAIYAALSILAGHALAGALHNIRDHTADRATSSSSAR